MINLVLICAQVVIINNSGLEWNDHDAKTLAQARQVCKVRYPEAPCVNTFYKLGARNYRVVCGQNVEE